MRHVLGGAATGRRAATAGKAWSVALLVVAVTAAAAYGAGDDSGHSNAQAGTSAQGQSGGTLVWGKPAEVAGIDPTTNTQYTSWQLLSIVYEGLVGIGDDLKPTPKLATSWKQTSPTTYVFTIRSGVRFSNGRPMTVDDVVGSLKRVADPKIAALWATFVGKIKKVSAKGTSRVEVVLSQPNTAFVAALAGVSAAVLPMKELRSGAFKPQKELLGTGPFKVASHRQGEVWNLVRNPYYWQRGLPKADKLTVRIMKDDAARIAGLRSGTLAVASFDTPDAVKLLEGQRNVKTGVVKTTDFFMLEVNAKSSIFKDPRLREALSLSIDRKQIADVALAGTSEPTAAVPPSFGTCNPAAVPYASRDPKRAAALVEQAGAKGKTVSLMASTTTYPPLGQIAQVLQPKLEAAGLKVKIEQPDQGEWIKRVYSGKADFDLDVSFFGSYADPAMGLTWWGPDQSWHSAWRVDDKKLFALVAKSRTQPKGAARDKTIKAACARIAKDAFIVPLVTKTMVAAYRSDKLTAVIPKVEGYGNVMRDVADFSVNGG
jgi:peptide/nickel transport system substrate-binding protein